LFCAAVRGKSVVIKAKARFSRRFPLGVCLAVNFRLDLIVRLPRVVRMENDSREDGAGSAIAPAEWYQSGSDRIEPEARERRKCWTLVTIQCGWSQSADWLNQSTANQLSGQILEVNTH
jgi:hypothetical protein